ncbi:MAG: P1 family peptidase [Tabrizicola sp.]|nr:P1 family peptidase [Tabrizicola sp.]
MFLAFSTANEGPMPQFSPAVVMKRELNIELLDNLYLAAVQSIEEAVVNAMVAGEEVPTVRPEGLVCRALNTDRLRAIFAR